LGVAEAVLLHLLLLQMAVAAAVVVHLQLPLEVQVLLGRVMLEEQA